MSEDTQTAKGLPTGLMIMLGTIVAGLLIIAIKLVVG
jgi:hypothetical protein